jgi:hypothetical protein
MGNDHVVAGQDDRLLSGQEWDDVPGQGASQSEERPPGSEEDAAITGDVPRRRRAGRGEEVGDGPASGRDDRGSEQQEALIGRLSEDWGEAIENRVGFIG